MSEQIYEYEIENRTNGDLFAWKWGDWKHTARWTSDIAKSADDGDDLARSGLKSAKNVLLLAVPQLIVNSGLKEKTMFEIIRIVTFRVKDTGEKKFVRKAVYSDVYAHHFTPYGDKKSRDGNARRASYNEWMLEVRHGVDILYTR